MKGVERPKRRHPTAPTCPTAFCDFGIAWNETNEFATDNFLTGYGLGFRLIVPSVNLIKFDLGFGGDDKSVRLRIGSSEKVRMERRRVR